jgi:hypothetical protein
MLFIGEPERPLFVISAQFPVLNTKNENRIVD